MNKNSELKWLEGKDYITKPKDLNNPDFQSGNVDYVFSCHSSYLPQLQGFYIYSNYILEKIFEDLKRVKNWLPGYKATAYYNWLLGGAGFLTRNKFKDDIEFEDWLKNNSFDGIKWLYSNKLTDTIENMFISLRNPQFINSMLSVYGVFYTFDDRHLKDFDNWTKKELPSLLRQIKFMNSIGIYWFGYPDEKERAKEYLVKFSKQDFEEPEKYLQWYRKKYCGYEY
jgi:hypothetical protein